MILILFNHVLVSESEWRERMKDNSRINDALVELLTEVIEDLEQEQQEKEMQELVKNMKEMLKKADCFGARLAAQRILKGKVDYPADIFEAFALCVVGIYYVPYDGTIISNFSFIQTSVDYCKVHNNLETRMSLIMALALLRQANIVYGAAEKNLVDKIKKNGGRVIEELERDYAECRRFEKFFKC